MAWKQPIDTDLITLCQGNKFATTVFILLLLRAKNKDGYYYMNDESIFLKRGQCFCDRFELAGWFDMKRNCAGRIQRILSFLEKTVKLIIKQKTRNGSIISILNFDKLIQFDQSDDQSMINQRSINDQSMIKPIIDKSVKSVKIDKSDKKNTLETEFDFEKVWKKYPNKDGRKEAEKHFNTSVKNEKDYSDIQKASENYKAHLKINTWKHPKNGSTWFNNWRDWINFVEPPQPKEKSSRVDIDETDWSKEKPGIVEDF